MRYTKPRVNETLPYSTVKIQGCSDTNVEFTLLSEQPTVGKRRYCNKVLVHECVNIPADAPLDLTSAEFIATSDNCYKRFEIYKSSLEVDDVNPTITFELNDDDLVTSILVEFNKDETCCLPLRLAYRLYGNIADTDERRLLSNGVLYVTPCAWTEDCGQPEWTDVVW